MGLISSISTMAKAVDETMQDDIQQVTPEGQPMDVAEEERLLRDAALTTKRLQTLQIIPSGPAGNSLSKAPGGPSLSTTATLAGSSAGAPTGAPTGLAPPAPPAPAPPASSVDQTGELL